MKIISLILLILLISVPSSYSDENTQTHQVASAGTGSGIAALISDTGNRIEQYDIFDGFELLDLTSIYHDTYVFISRKYSHYKDLDILNSHMVREAKRNSATFFGGILPFVNMPDREDGSILSQDGMSIFFFYKQNF